MKGKILFKGNFEIENQLSQIEVYLLYNNQQDVRYRCVINKKISYEVSKGFEGEWFDSEDGSITNISEKLGNIIDENYDAPNAV